MQDILRARRWRRPYGIVFAAAAGLTLWGSPASADQPASLSGAAPTPTPAQDGARADGELQSFKHLSTLASTIPDNGDLNPYAVFVAPASSGVILKGDVIVDNFNNGSNLQGTGGSIVLVNPTTRAARLFAKISQNLPQCPGGVGLSTALAMLSSGWVIVGSTPSRDGTTATKATIFDMMNQFVTNTGGGHFACPAGSQPGDYVGRALLEG